METIDNTLNRYNLKLISANREVLTDVTEFLKIEEFQTYRLNHNTSLILIYDEDFTMYRVYEYFGSNNIELEKSLNAYIKDRLMNFPPKIRSKILP